MKCQGMAWGAVLFLAFLGGCAYQPSTPSSPAAGDPPKPAQAQTYHIGVDDKLQVNVWRNPDLSVKMPVRPDGKISMPLIGDVQAGGRTPEHVAAEIRSRLSQYIRQPNVTVMVTELHSHEYLSRIRVTGAVRKPLSLPYRQGMTVVDAVLEAGGLNEFAAADRARVYRRTASGTKSLPIHLDAILKRGEMKTNISLKAGDIVSVPERLF